MQEIRYCNLRWWYSFINIQVKQEKSVKHASINLEIKGQELIKKKATLATNITVSIMLML